MWPRNNLLLSPRGPITRGLARRLVKLARSGQDKA
jgi:hypothetical protein